MLLLDDFLNGQDYIISAHKVGPTIADDIKRTAVIVVFASLLIIFLYILAVSATGNLEWVPWLPWCTMC